jgi:hypothetical protein
VILLLSFENPRRRIFNGEGLPPNTLAALDQGCMFTFEHGVNLGFANVASLLVTLVLLKDRMAYDFRCGAVKKRTNQWKKTVSDVEA